VKFAAIADWADLGTYPVVFMCTELKVSRSGYYAWRAGGPSNHAIADQGFTVIIKAIYDQGRGNPGVRRVRAGLAALGHRLSHKRVWRLMQAAGLQGRHPKAWKRTTVPGDHPVSAPDLIKRDFTAASPNTRWCGDITYIKTWEGWAYLATVIDLYSRKVVGYALADHMRTDLITEALDMAIATRRPSPGLSFIPTVERSTRPDSSTGTARRTTFGVHSGRPGSVTTMPFRNLSSRPTRRNSSIPVRGLTLKACWKLLSNG